MSREPVIKATSRTFIDIGLRRFVVEYNGPDVIRIKERKTDRGAVRETSYWSAKHHQVGGPDSMTARILAAAREKAVHGAKAEA